MELQGKAVADAIYKTIQNDLKSLSYKPGLAVVLVGEDPASQVYVNKKVEKAKELGYQSQKFVLPSDTKQEALIEKILELNEDNTIDGILLQLPLPKHLDADILLNIIDPAKDVDGLTSFQAGLLMHNHYSIAPCTPSGIMTMLEHYNYSLESKTAVVIGRSKIVGLPMFQLLQLAGASVSLCHSKTRDIKSYTQKADLVVVAAGKPEFFDASYFSKKATVIDVGIHRKENGKLCGDLAEDVKSHVENYSPVPGGVGPLTIATLMKNTLTLAENRRS